jgi:tRNA (adenine22-N1)-methyltransferase
VRKDSIFADIGTDHAYVPIFLITKGICQKGYASDLRQGPLDSARKNLNIYGGADNIELFISDGLKEYKDIKVDDYIIAGMGGELIAKIISEAPFEITDNMQFVFQPMSSEEELRIYLNDNGFKTVSEIAVSDKDKDYIVMTVKKGSNNIKDYDVYKYIGFINPALDDSKKYVRKKIKSLYKKYDGLTVSGNTDDAEKVMAIIKKLRREINED